jgi:hypothetical protein
MGYSSEMDRKALRNFLHSRRSDAPCPFCGENEWEGLKGDPDVGLPIRTPAPPEGSGIPNVPATLLFCENCGFIRLHLDGVLTGEWQPKPVITDD